MVKQQIILCISSHTKKKKILGPNIKLTQHVQDCIYFIVAFKVTYGEEH